MPQDAPLTVRNSFGGVTVDGLKAATDIDDKNGSVAVHDGKGSQLLRNAFGSIELLGNEGDADVATSNGGVRVARIQGG